MGDTFVVERTKKIDAPPAQVFPHVANLRAWDTWSPWGALDPDMSKTFTGDDGAIGSSYQWAGNRKVGQGKMTITEVTPPERVEIDLQFIKPFKAENVTEMIVSPDGDGSQVLWRMTGEHNWMSKLMGIFRSMDKMVGPDFEKGLASLKALAEK